VPCGVDTGRKRRRGEPSSRRSGFHILRTGEESPGSRPTDQVTGTRCWAARSVEPGRHSAAEDDKKVSVQQPVAQPVDSWMNVMPGSVNPATAAQWQAGVRLDTAGLGICRFFLNKKKS